MNQKQKITVIKCLISIISLLLYFSALQRMENIQQSELKLENNFQAGTILVLRDDDCLDR